MGFLQKVLDSEKSQNPIEKLTFKNWSKVLFFCILLKRIEAYQIPESAKTFSKFTRIWPV
jgi:hypothetical protein